MTQPPSQGPTPILVERRFPLDLAHTIKSIRDLYDTSKAERWDPTIDIDWAAFDAAAYDATTLEAARLTWSRRAWIEYTGLPETPALLIRFCLEIGREADPKYYLSVRNTEEAWHVECCHRFATALGGYVSEPPNTRYGDLLSQGFHKHALDADASLDAYVAAHCAFGDGLDYELWRGYLANARDAVAKRILELCVADKQRHAAFGWFYLERRADGWSDAERARIAAEVERYLWGLVFQGYHCPWLAPDGSGAELAAADAVTATAGLGALDAAGERAVLEGFLAVARAKLAGLGIDLPATPVPVR